MYLRYRLVSELNRDADARVSRCNRVAWCMAVVSCLGLSIVANFQENAVRAVHLTGACACFGCGAVYCCLHSHITHRMFPLYTGRRICIVRLAIAVVGTVTYVIGERLYDRGQ